VTEPTPAAAHARVLEYPRSGYPRVESGPGYARLLMPPVERQKAVVGLVLVLVVGTVVGFFLLATGVLAVLVARRSGTPVPTPTAKTLAVGVLVLASMVATVTWFVKQSHVAPTFEFAGGFFTRILPGLARPRTTRTPLSDVVAVSASEERAIGPRGWYWVRVTVVVLPTRRITRRFLAPNAGVAAPFEAAFKAVLHERDARTRQPVGGGGTG
jgi:hypothetical protein